MLADIDARQRFFHAVSHPKDGDVHEIRKIKEKINHMIHAEIEEM